MAARIDDLETLAGHGKTRPKNTGTKKLFDNPILEALSRTHIMVPVTMWLILSAFLCWYAFNYTDMGASKITLLFVTGLFGFTLFEYILHRYLYHLAPTTPKRAKIQYTFHGVHHEYPKDKTRLAMPPRAGYLRRCVFLRYVLSDDGRSSLCILPRLSGRVHRLPVSALHRACLPTTEELL